ncbi:MAG: glycosyltransferase family 2 protein, partial [Pyrinomonadaceae bacterium]|nr:glycosyltransferase family 2 protein [Pyrinomonadaceae bacterium]
CRVAANPRNLESQISNFRSNFGREIRRLKPPFQNPQMNEFGENLRESAPRVSVVIPAYKVTSFIEETLQSVFAQTFTDYETIVINDGSPDTNEFEAIIKPHLSKIVYVKKENGGAASARNAGINVARGEIVAFLDGDDVWKPNFLQSQIEFFDSHDFDMIYADADFFGENVEKGQTYMQFSKSNGAVTITSLLGWTCNVITSGTIVYRHKLIEAGLFDESSAFRQGQDFEMWIRLLKTGAKIGYQREVLLKYRVRNDGLSGDEIRQSERSINVLNALQSKYDFDDAQQIVLEKQIARAVAMWETERGKAALLNGDFKQARASFAAANNYFRAPKLYAVSILARFAPKLLQRFFFKRTNGNLDTRTT